MRRPRIVLFPIVISVILFVSGPAVAGEVYKWVDKEGGIHFSDAPISDGERRVEKVFSGSASPPVEEECVKPRRTSVGFNSAGSVSWTYDPKEYQAYRDCLDRKDKLTVPGKRQRP